MKQWQEDQRAELRRQDMRPARGTLADDVEQYLKLVEPRLVSFKDRRYDLHRWLERFGHRHRHTLETNELQTQLNEWRLQGFRRRPAISEEWHCRTCSRHWTESGRVTRYRMFQSSSVQTRSPTHFRMR